MTATCYGIACAERDLASYPDGRAHSVDRLIPQLPDDGVTVTVCHDDTLKVGELVHGELDERGQLHCVCTVEDWLVNHAAAAPLYYSAELLVVGPGVATRSRFIADARALTGLSITDSPATVAAMPIVVLPGDIRSAPDRATWPLSWHHDHPLLQRCLDHLGHDPWKRSAVRLVDERDAVPVAGWVNYDGTASRGPSSHATGAVLRVR
jgi:hypothetical protein